MKDSLFSEGKIIPVGIVEQMRSAYIDYAMSVIVARALPDVRDGLKPVHRRVLYGMHELGLYHNKPYKKSARVVGEVLGKYHPHGDSAVYEAMVRMAQPWSLRYPLVDGQGNFGSIDGDGPAAMRYTEVRLTRIAEEMLADLQLDTVNFTDNFDGSLKEPVVLPAKIPQLLMNGATGIAVGMSTEIPPHNLSELVEGIKAYIDNPQISVEELMQYIPAPDFPTGGIIYGYEGVKQTYLTGKGKIVLRGKAEIETKKNRHRIVITEIPYRVEKAALIERIAELAREKKLEGIEDLRDESDRRGMRIVIELKKGVNPKVVLNSLYVKTPLQTNFNANCIALVHGRPRLLNLKEMIRYYVEHRHTVVLRRTRYLLKQAERQAHILEGLLIALDHLDEVIQLIRSSENPTVAKEQLMQRFQLTEVQAQAILDMRLQRLTGLEREKIKKDYENLKEKIAYYKKVLSDESLQMQIIKDELDEIKERYGDERRTEIVKSTEEFSEKDIILDKPVLITLSVDNYIRVTSTAAYRAQARGGKGGKAGGNLKEEDKIKVLIYAHTHDELLFFTEKGKCFALPVHALEILDKKSTSRGRSIRNYLQIPDDDSVLTVLNVRHLKDPNHLKGKYLLFCTAKGIAKRVALEAFSNVRKSGLTVMNFKGGDKLVNVALCTDDDEVFIITKEGYCNRFPVKTIRPMGRTAQGVIAIKLQNESDRVVAMLVNGHGQRQLLTITTLGYGKRTPLEQYRQTNRGTKGVVTHALSEKSGKLAAAALVHGDEHLILITQKGIAIRVRVEEISQMNRNARGARVIKVAQGDKVAAIAVVPKPTT